MRTQPNLLRALANIVNNPITEIREYYRSRNRINNVGEALETYCKDAFSSAFGKDKESEKMLLYHEAFSYIGNQNNPPDIILLKGDAIEVKKIQSSNSALALNSSYPKSKLFADSKMITNACRNCEKGWSIKDIIYIVGHTTDESLKSLWLVYGDCYAADKEVYERIKSSISDGVNLIPDIEFAETNELGKVKKVDPLGITDLRIRGMWHIKNPKDVFDYVYQYDSTAKFQLVSIIRGEKYKSFPIEDRNALESLKNENLLINEAKIKDPDNPAKLIDAKLIIFKRK